MPEAILVLTLLVPPDPVVVGASVPIAVEVRNVSERPVWIVGVVDGSEEGIRYPHYRPRVSLGGETVAAPPPAEDPLVSPLRVVDFVVLQPGEAFDPEGAGYGRAYLPLSTFANFRPTQPGTYVLGLSLSTESASPENWLGRFNQDAEREVVLHLVSQVPRLTTTATATVEVR